MPKILNFQEQKQARDDEEYDIEYVNDIIIYHKKKPQKKPVSVNNAKQGYRLPTIGQKVYPEDAPLDAGEFVERIKEAGRKGLPYPDVKPASNPSIDPDTGLMSRLDAYPWHKKAERGFIKTMKDAVTEIFGEDSGNKWEEESLRCAYLTPTRGGHMLTCDMTLGNDLADKLLELGFNRSVADLLRDIDANDWIQKAGEWNRTHPLSARPNDYENIDPAVNDSKPVHDFKTGETVLKPMHTRSELCDGKCSLYLGVSYYADREKDKCMSFWAGASIYMPVCKHLEDGEEDIYPHRVELLAHEFFAPLPKNADDVIKCAERLLSEAFPDAQPEETNGPGR